MANIIRDIMSTNVVTCTPQNNAYDLAVKMKQNDIGFIPIVEGQKLVGLITDRDLVTRCCAEKLPDTTAVAQLMTTHLETISPDDPIEGVAERMSANQIRRLPVVENGNLIGVISIGDIALRDDNKMQAMHALSSISEHDHREPPAVH
jgi:CBS domain-containing protein